MRRAHFPDDQVEREQGGKSITLVVLDGVGGLPIPGTGLTELEAARTPNLDDLAGASSLGMNIPVAPGITPGSGPGHLALFGYDPRRVRDRTGGPERARRRVRRAGRGRRGSPELGHARRGRDASWTGGRGARAARRDDASSIVSGTASTHRGGVELHLKHLMEHRAVMVLRGEGLGANLTDTDPQEIGVPPRPTRSEGEDPASAATADMVNGILAAAANLLADEPSANALLARGFDKYEGFPTFRDRFGMTAAAVARYPMYRGVARLVGMAIPGVPDSDDEAVDLMERTAPDFDFRFFHYKATDSRGEDGDFDAKVAAIEAADELVGRMTDADVVVITGDHSTPATFGAHSWHAVPLLIRSEWARPTGRRFTETDCRNGDIGTIEGRHIMSLALAHAERLAKFGA